MGKRAMIQIRRGIIVDREIADPVDETRIMITMTT
jgi:hypothetical protein